MKDYTPIPPPKYPITQIVTNLSVNYFEKVLYQVKDHYPHASPELNSTRSKVLDSLFNLNREERRGFEKVLRNAMVLKPGQKVRVIPHVLTYMFAESEEVGNAILELWMDANPELLQSASKELKRRHRLNGIQGDAPEQSKDAGVDAEVIEKFVEGHPKYGREDAALMFSCLTGVWPRNLVLAPDVAEAAPSLDEQSTEELEAEDDGADDSVEIIETAAENEITIELQGTRWEAWYKEADQIDASDNSWDTAQAFVQHFALLIDRKLTQRKQNRTDLANAFDLLSSEFSDELMAYGNDIQDYGHWKTWDLQLCGFDDIGDLTTRIQRLHQAFSELAELKRRPWPVGPTESQKHFAQLGILQGETESLYKSIASSLSPQSSQNGGVAVPAVGLDLSVGTTIESVHEELLTLVVPENDVVIEPTTDPTSSRNGKDNGEGNQLSGEYSQPPIQELVQEPEFEPVPLKNVEPQFPPVAKIPEPDFAFEHSIYSFAPDDPVEKIAKAVLDSDCSDDLLIRDLIWRLVYEDKLDLAFAVSRFSEDSKAEHILRLSPWLLSSLTVGPYILLSGGRIAESLSHSLMEFVPLELFVIDQKEWNQAVRLLLAAATMRAALVAPRTGAPEILTELQFTALPYLFEYCRHLAETELTRNMDFETLKGVKEYVSWKRRLDSLRTDAGRWQKDALNSVRIDYTPALKVWQYFVRYGLIKDLLDPITADAVPQIQNVEKLLRRYVSNEKALKELITKTDRGVLDRPLSGPNFDFKNPSVSHLMGGIQKALQYAQTWVDIQKGRPHQSSSYLQRTAEELSTELLSYREKVVRELEFFASNTNSLPILSGIKHCRRALENVWALFDPEVDLPNTEPDLNLMLFGNLLRVRNLTLDDEWNFESSDQKHILTELVRTIAEPEADWQQAFDFNKDTRGDHVATLRIIEYLQLNPEAAGSFGPAVELSKDREKSLREWRESLRTKIESTKVEVERGYANDWLQEDESDNYQKRIQGARESADNVLRFANRMSELDSIREDLNSKLELERERVQARFWQLGLDATHPSYKRVQEALEKNDFSTANEYIEILKEGEALPDPEDNTDYLRAFFPQVPREWKKSGAVTKTAIVHKLRTKQTLFGLDLSGLSDEKALEAADMISLWFDIKAKGMIQNDKLEKLFNYLGFGETKVTTSTQYGKRFWLDAHTQTIRDKKTCPVPTYGSRARGQYRLFCVFDNAMDEDLFHSIGANQQRPVIVFYFDILSEQDRIRIGQLCRSSNQQRTFIVIDSALMLYLCTQPTRRLRALFDCSLPFTWLQPYLSIGKVPFETFYGRKKEKLDIMNPTGPCFIYGGKRLGKTALLGEIVDEFHKPEEERIAIFIDLKEVGIASLSIDRIWPILIEKLQGKDTDNPALKDLKIIKTSNVSVDTLLSNIQSWLDQGPDRRILILLDEADAFLDRDGEERSGQGDAAEFIRVHKMMKLWERTNGRFKVVFAGLHNVLRTTKVVNKVNPSLWHFGEAEDASRCIGPLVGKERNAALSLVKRPFFSLGYRFESEDLILRIMSHTNWYPSLIQLYCNHLLRHLNESHTPIYDPKMSPPYVITSKHIDDVYRKILQTQLKERFKLTLQLDARYKVIAHSIAYRLLSDEKSHITASLSVEEIQHEALKWWSEGFRKTGSSTDESFRALLDEMNGLGIVRQEGEGQYTLRSLNIFSILGKKSEIERVLREKHNMPALYERATFRSAHPARNSEALFFKRSPLTAQQVDQLEEHKNGASIIFGSTVAGLDDLGTFLSVSVGKNFYARMDSVNHLEEFIENLKARISKRETQGLTLIEVSPSCPWNSQWISETINILSKLTSQQAWVRVAFVADPQKAWEIIRNSVTELFSMVTRGLTQFSLTPWHDSALAQWLNDSNFSDDDQEWIKYVSNNWPLILEELPQLQANSSSSIECMEKFAGKFDEKDFIDKLFRGFGLELQEPQEILKALAEYGTPLNTEELHALTGKPMDLVKSTVSWAERLMMIIQGERETWSIDPVVARVLKKSTGQPALEAT